MPVPQRSPGTERPTGHASTSRRPAPGERLVAITHTFRHIYGPQLLTTNHNLPIVRNTGSRYVAIIFTTFDNFPQLSSPNQRVGGSIPSRRTINAGHRPAKWRSSLVELSQQPTRKEFSASVNNWTSRRPCCRPEGSASAPPSLPGGTLCAIPGDLGLPLLPSNGGSAIALQQDGGPSKRSRLPHERRRTQSHRRVTVRSHSTLLLTGFRRL